MYELKPPVLQLIFDRDFPSDYIYYKVSLRSCLKGKSS